MFAPAKINWHLTIEKKRADGFHDINTIFQTLNWGDELECRVSGGEGCRITCDQPEVPLGDDNLIARAWCQLAGAYPEKVRGTEIRLTKRIPLGAGLGGGSSDAAATLVGLNRLYRLGLKGAALEAMAAELGSDCAFFIRGGTAVGSGRGECLNPLNPGLPQVALVVVHPGFHSSTAGAYEKIRPEHWENERTTKEVAKAITQGDMEALIKNCRNIFYEVVSAEDFRYKEINNRMNEEKLDGVLMTGSGSAFFGLARDRKHALNACRSLGRYYPTAVATSLRRGGITIRK